MVKNMKIEWTKVTWYSRILSLIIFTALPFWGFYLGYNYGQTQISGPIVVDIGPVRQPVNAALVNTSSWATYQNGTYGLSFKYPTELEVMNPTGLWRYFASATSTGTQLVKFEVPKIFEMGTNFGDAQFNVGVSASPADVRDCFLAGPGETASSTVYINGGTFYKFVGSDAGAGNFYQIESYRTIHGNACYDIDLIIHSSNIQNYPPEFGIKQFDYHEVHSMLVGMLQTLTFTQ